MTLEDDRLLATTPSARERVRAMRSSLLRLTGRDLHDGLDPHDPEAAVFDAPYALLSHDTAADPVFVYGNATALRLFERGWADFTALPSRLSAEPVARAERDSLLARVREFGFIDDYRGVRISASGSRFVIVDALVWTVTTDDGLDVGQAALVERVEPIDGRDAQDERRA